MAMTFDQIFAADPANPSNIAQNASITIFAPGDETMTPIAITDPDGQPLPNPIPVNANGFGSAFMADIDRVAWAGGGFTGFFTSYDGMKAEAVAAREAAETAVSDAAASATAAANSAALVGAPADTAIATAINGAGETKAALDTNYGIANPTLVVTYNGDGSVASTTENGVLTTFTYNADGTVNTQTRAGATKTFTYDANGNVTGAA